MRRLQFFAIFIIVTLFCTGACAFTVSYEQTSTGPGLVKPETRSIKIKDDKIRIEMAGPQEKSVIIVEGDTMYSYTPSQNKAVKMKTDMWRGMDVLSDYASYLESLDAKVVGRERVGPYDCDIYECIDPRINMKSKVWLWKAKEFPVKVEMEVQGGVMATIMKNVKIGIHIDDSEFMLPPGVEIVETSGMEAH